MHAHGPVAVHVGLISFLGALFKGFYKKGFSLLALLSWCDKHMVAHPHCGARGLRGFPVTAPPGRTHTGEQLNRNSLKLRISRSISTNVSNYINRLF